jgi:hypothetical protein
MAPGQFPGEGSGHWPAQMRIADNDFKNLLSKHVRGDPAQGGFDFGQFWHDSSVTGFKAW